MKYIIFYTLILCHIWVHRAGAQNNPVTLTNLPESVNVTENSPLGSSVYAVTKDDSDATDNHTFTLTSSPTSGQTFFWINETSGLISISNTNSIDYESLTSTTFTLFVVVSDGTATDTQSLTVTILDVNEAPWFDPYAYTLAADEGQAAGTSLGIPSFVVLDSDDQDDYTLSLSCGAYTGYFIMNSTTGEVQFQSQYNIYDGLPSPVPCTVTATDKGGLTGTANLTLLINSINTAPQFNPTLYSFDVSYYAGVGTSIGAITATDADAATTPYGQIDYSIDQSALGDNFFGVTSSGDIFAKMSLSRLGGTTSNTVPLSVAVTDRGGLTDAATVNIVISELTTVTTTLIYNNFGDDGRNIGWLIPAILLGLATAAFAGWVLCTCRGANSWANLKKLIFPEKRLYDRWNDPVTPRASEQRHRHHHRGNYDRHARVHRVRPNRGFQFWTVNQ